MSRSALNFAIDAVAFVAFVFLTSTGILARYVLPPGSGRWTTLWGLDRHGWGDIHFWIAVVLLGVLAMHLALHWRWVVCMVRGQRSQASGARVALGLVGALGLLALAAAPVLTPVERVGEPAQRGRPGPPPGLQGRPGASRSGAALTAPAAPAGVQAPQAPAAPSAPAREEESPGGEDIRGSMTLREAAQSAGVPLDRLIERLGLPQGFDADERIGQMRKRLGISPDDVRHAVKDYRAAH